MIILTLLASSTIVFARVDSQDPTDFQGIGKVYVDASAVLKQLGYTEKNIASAPEKLLPQILRSYPTYPTRSHDGDYYVTITNNSLNADAVNIVGSDTTVPYTLPDMPNSNAATDLLAEKACLIIAIWDYPGTGADLDAEYVYDMIYDWVSTSGCYDYWHTLVNDEATNYNVWAWITWACATYEDVDIYFRGHGTEVSIWGLTISAYLCYDAWDDFWGVLTWNLFFPADITSGEYDYSTMRAGVFGFCYGFGFSDTFLDPGGSTSHDRALTGPAGESYVSYSYVFIDTYCEWWYDYSYSSYESYLEAYDAASGYGGSPYSYDDTGNAIWA